MPDLDLILAVGGPGTQTGEGTWPGAMLRSYFDAQAVADWNGTNGVAKVSNTGRTIVVAGAISGFTDTGAFAGMTLTGLCVAITAVTTTSDIGYYEITTHDDNDLTFRTVGVDGVNTVVNGDTVSYSIGGSGDTIALADATLGAFLANNAVEVLDNLSETPGATTVDMIATVLYPITYTGTIYDNSVVNNNFVRATDVTDMPVINMGVDNNFTISGTLLRFRNIVVTGDNNGRVFSITAGKVIVEHCKISQTGVAANDDSAIFIDSAGDGSIIRGNHITSTVPTTTITSAAIYASQGVQIINNFIESVQAGLHMLTSSTSVDVRGNIFSGSGNNVGISVTGSVRGGGVVNNSVYNYATGINVFTAAGGSDFGRITFLNNVIYGASAASSIGIQNDNVATSINYLVDNNAIGNVLTAYEFGDLIIENKIDLSTNNPFDNPGGTAADDYKLNTGTGGNLCRSAAKPSDFDSDGTQDNWGDVGALQAEPTGGAGGGVMPMTGLLS